MPTAWFPATARCPAPAVVPTTAFPPPAPPPSPLPACPSVLLDPIMGMVSTAVIGSKLGTAPLAAVGLVTICFNFSK